MPSSSGEPVVEDGIGSNRSSGIGGEGRGGEDGGRGDGSSDPGDGCMDPGDKGGGDTIDGGGNNPPTGRSDPRTASPDMIVLEVSWGRDTLDREDVEAILQGTRKFMANHRILVQYMLPEAVHGEEHLASALLHALRAGAEGRSRTRDPALDVLRFLTGERQIRSAIRMAGLSPGRNRYVCLAFVPDPCGAHQGSPGAEEAVRAFLGEIGFRVREGSVPATGSLHDALERTAMTDLKL